jgi:hypothetical protein
LVETSINSTKSNPEIFSISLIGAEIKAMLWALLIPYNQLFSNVVRE